MKIDFKILDDHEDAELTLSMGTTEAYEQFKKDYPVHGELLEGEKGERPNRHYEVITWTKDFKKLRVIVYEPGN